MDPMKLPEFIEQYPAFFRTALVAWLVLSALLLGGFLTLRQASGSKRITPVDPKPVVPLVVDAEPGPTIEQYITRLEMLRGRFIELDTYKKSLTGQQVEWPGEVRAISISEDRKQVNVLIAYSAGRSRLLDYWARVTGDDINRALALRENDHLQVSGRLSWQLGQQPAIDVEKLIVLPDSESTTKKEASSTALGKG